MSVFDSKVNNKDGFDATTKASLQQFLNYVTACAKFASYEFSAALEAVSAAITGNSVLIDYQILHAEILLEQWKFADAEAVLSALTSVSQAETPVAANIQMLQGRLLLAMGRYEVANPALQTASNLFTSLFGDSYFKLFECKYYQCLQLYYGGRYEQASDKIRLARSHLSKMYPNSPVVRKMVQLHIACLLRLNDMKAVQQVMTNNFDQSTISYVLLQEKLCCASVAIEGASLEEAEQLLGEVKQETVIHSDVFLFSWYALLQGRLASTLAQYLPSVTYLLQCYTLRSQSSSASFDTLEAQCYLALSGYNAPLKTLREACAKLENGHLTVLCSHALIDKLLTEQNYSEAVATAESLQQQLLVDIVVPQLFQVQTTLRLVECYILQQQPTKAYEILQTCKASVERDFSDHSVRGWYGCLLAECDRQLKRFSEAKSIGTQTLSLLSHIFDTSHQQCLLVRAVLGLVILEQCEDLEECDKGEEYINVAMKELARQNYGSHRWYSHISGAYESVKESKPKPESVVEQAPEPIIAPVDNMPKLKELTTQNRLLTSQLQHCEKMIDDMKLHQAILENQKNTAMTYAESLQQIVNNVNGNAPKSLKQVASRVTLASRMGYAKKNKYKSTSVGVDESVV